MSEQVGLIALGVFMGYMAWYFATRVKENWMTSFAAVAGVLFGGVVLTFLGGASSDNRWWYPIGLVIGWLIYAIARKLVGEGWPTISD